jgi:hypothetical protein
MMKERGVMPVGQRGWCRLLGPTLWMRKEQLGDGPAVVGGMHTHSRYSLA